MRKGEETVKLVTLALRSECTSAGLFILKDRKYSVRDSGSKFKFYATSALNFERQIFTKKLGGELNKNTPILIA